MNNISVSSTINEPQNEPQKANNETTEEGAIDVEGKTAEQIVELLNSYKDDTGAYPTDWKQWKVGKDGNPTFAD